MTRAKYIARAGRISTEGVGLLCWIGAYERVHGHGVTIGRLGAKRKQTSSWNTMQVRQMIALGYVQRGEDKRVTLTEKGWAEVQGRAA